MLKGVLIVAYIVIVVIGIGKECISCGEHIGCAQVGGRQLSLLGISDCEYFLGFIIQVLSQFVPKVGVRVPVADDLDGL